MKKIHRCNNGDGEDRLSGLPCSLLHHILSFLPTKTVVQTCVLSKTWKQLWCSVPSLDLDWSSVHPSNFIDSVLLFRDNPVIENMRLSCRVRPDDVSKITLWILHAIEHKVQCLELQIVIYETVSPVWLMPRLFTCSSLRVLKLIGVVGMSTSICLPLLKILYLKGVRFLDEQTEALSSSSPFLEKLVLKGCHFKDDLKSLEISGCQLRNLTMKGVFPKKTIISAPNLVSLKLSLDLPKSDLYFADNLVSLVKAHIDVPVAFYKARTQCVGVVQNAHVLTLSNVFVQSMAELAQEGRQILEDIQIPFHNLKLLKLNTTSEGDRMLVINTLLKNCPSIETLILGECVECWNMVSLTEPEPLFEYTLPHLKMVKSEYVQGYEHEIKLLKFLLKNSPVLEKFIVEYGDIPQDETRKIAKDLYTSPRASSSIVMVFL